jgi:hypothetical protein
MFLLRLKMFFIFVYLKMSTAKVANILKEYKRLSTFLHTRGRVDYITCSLYIIFILIELLGSKILAPESGDTIYS